MDYYIFQQLNNLAGQYKLVADLTVFFGRYFQYFLVGGVCLYLAARNPAFRDFRKIALALLAAVISRFGFASGLRQLYFRPRPFVSHQVYQLIPQDFLKGSFPSGHMAFLFAFGMFLYMSNKRVGQIVFGGGILIGIARIFGGVHYPSDILGGIILGVLVGWGSYKIFKKYLNQ